MRSETSPFVILSLVLSLSSMMLISYGIIAVSSEASASSFGKNREIHVGLHEPTYVFKFQAYDVCIKKYQQCFNIWGEGNYNDKFKEVTAHGYYVKYIETPTNVLESAWWIAIEFLDASNTHVIFKAEPGVKGQGGAGFLGIEVLEGKTPDTGRVCVYGNLFDKENPSSEADADCTNNAYVKIEPAG